MKTRSFIVSIVILLLFLSSSFAQQKESANIETLLQYIKKIDSRQESMRHYFDMLGKKIDDVLWYFKVGDIAEIDKVRFTSVPPRVIKNPKRYGAKNPVKFYSYVFIPKNIDRTKKYPLLLFPHGGVHSNFSTYYTHIVRELIKQGYCIIASEYRGSTGYGEGFYKLIDYGGLEVEDVFKGREYMLENYSFIDPERVGILGWSHGGLITLMNIFNHPEAFKVAFAGVPVSDLVARMGYATEGYRKLYSAEYHIGKTAHEDVEEYRRRSPVWNAHKLQTPLLIHTNTNDEDVNVLEVESLIRALKAEGKKFEYQIFKDYPGGHSFDRLDSKTAKKIRLKIYKFLAGYLNPPNPFNNVDEF
ncbi:S9 family peptidase [candidate division KSB1 bacterium]|nr:MAG: S9 family peptidase [candidate division KSB1 bacterium]